MSCKCNWYESITVFLIFILHLRINNAIKIKYSQIQPQINFLLTDKLVNQLSLISPTPLRDSFKANVSELFFSSRVFKVYSSLHFSGILLFMIIFIRWQTISQHFPFTVSARAHILIFLVSISAITPRVCVCVSMHAVCYACTLLFEPVRAPEGPSPAVLGARSDSCTVMP